jgi:DNA-binding NtrC family response regulator
MKPSLDASGAEASGAEASGQTPSVAAGPTSASSKRLDLAADGFILHFVTRDPRVCGLLDMVRQVADTDATILITGESGTGKEFIARQLHSLSSRAPAPLVSVNCGAIAESLQESEFFGHTRGAFTGASERKLGKFEAAHGGTLFLDEISEMSPALQAKLLRVLQYGEYAPVGVAENRFCDVRIVAATNQDLRPLIQTGRFRQDLYYRLNIIRLEMPPLRERPDDIPLLIDHFLRLLGPVYRKPHVTITPEAMAVLRSYPYPGNVRELENIIRRGVILCRDGAIAPDHLAAEVLESSRPPVAAPVASFHDAKAQTVEQFERVYLISLLTACGGIVSRAALCSGLSERNFHEKLKKYGLSGKEFRVPARRTPAPPA